MDADFLWHRTFFPQRRDAERLGAALCVRICRIQYDTITSNFPLKINKLFNITNNCTKICHNYYVREKI